MFWIIVATGTVLVATLFTLFFLFRKVRHLEFQAVRHAPPPNRPKRAPFDSMELTLEAMLEEMEIRGRDIMKKIDRKEQELSRLIQEIERHKIIASHKIAEPFEGTLMRPSTTSHPNLVADVNDNEMPKRKEDAVLKMAAEGRDVPSIARALGLGIGEVRLILELKEKK